MEVVNLLQCSIVAVREKVEVLPPAACYDSGFSEQVFGLEVPGGLQRVDVYQIESAGPVIPDNNRVVRRLVRGIVLVPGNRKKSFYIV
jgi:hypothetical protein